VGSPTLVHQPNLLLVLVLALPPLPGVQPSQQVVEDVKLRLNLLLVLALPPLPGVQPSKQVVEDVKARLNLLL
jgi:hypothetical protein